MLVNLVDWANRSRSSVLYRFASSLAAVFVEGFGCDAIALVSHFIYRPRGVVQEFYHEGGLIYCRSVAGRFPSSPGVNGRKRGGLYNL